VTGWPLRPLLDLRTREEELATRRLGEAERAARQAAAEAVAARAEAVAAAALALRVESSAGHGGLASAQGLGEVRFRERLRLEASRRGQVADEAEDRARQLEPTVEGRRQALHATALRREAVAALGAAWRRERAAAEARRGEAALDDRPWTGRAAPGDRLSASLPASARPAPGHTRP